MLLGGLKQFCNCNGSDKIKVLGAEIREVFEVEVSEMLFVRAARVSVRVFTCTPTAVFRSVMAHFVLIIQSVNKKKNVFTARVHNRTLGEG